MSTDASPQTEDRDFFSILKSMAGRMVTVVNPESYEHAPVGFQLKAGFYRAKITGTGQDYLTLVTESIKPGKRGEEPTKDAVKQFIPFARIKRVSQMKQEILLHI